MPGFLLHANAVAQCMHAGLATIPPAQARVLVSGQPVAVMTGIITVKGCPFQIPFGPGTKPQPCVTIKWTMPSTRFLVGGQPALLQPTPGPGPGVGQSIEQIPQGPPMVSGFQTRVIGS